jgi:hypothetical protein
MQPETRKIVAEIYNELQNLVRSKEIPPEGEEFTVPGLMKDNALWKNTLNHNGPGFVFYREVKAGYKVQVDGRLYEIKPLDVKETPQPYIINPLSESQEEEKHDL